MCLSSDSMVTRRGVAGPGVRGQAESMSIKGSEPYRASEQKALSWSELVCYLVAGFGTLLSGSVVLSLVLEVGTLQDTVARYLLNALVLTGTVYLLGVRRGRVSWEELGFRPVVWRWSWVLLAIVLAVGLMPLRSAIGVAVQYFFSEGPESIDSRMDVLLPGFEFSWVTFGLSVVGAGVIVPIAEELYFRGLIHTRLKSRLGYCARVLLSSIIFGLAHVDSIGVAASSLIMGIANAIALEESGSIWLPIAIHVVTNTFVVVLLNLVLALL